MAADGHGQAQPQAVRTNKGQPPPPVPHPERCDSVSTPHGKEQCRPRLWQEAGDTMV